MITTSRLGGMPVRTFYPANVRDLRYGGGRGVWVRELVEGQGGSRSTDRCARANRDPRDQIYLDKKSAGATTAAQPVCSAARSSRGYADRRPCVTGSLEGEIEPGHAPRADARPVAYAS